MSFENKVVIVTGASSGIGAATAVLFAQQGSSVVLVARNPTKLQAVIAKCEAYGKKHLVIKVDVSEEGKIKQIVDQTIQKYGKIDVLVNNAGILRFANILNENYLQIQEEVMKVNLQSVVHLTHYAAQHLIATKGNIVNISSTAGTSVLPSSSYCTSKAALDHFTKCSAAELAPMGVRVNAVKPGPVKTDVMSNAGLSTEELSAFMAKMQIQATNGTICALNRISEPEEIGELVLFLASDKAVGITGSIFLSDNGLLLQ